MELLRVEREFCLHSYGVKERALVAAATKVERAAVELEAAAPQDAAYRAGLGLSWRREAAAVQAQAERARKLFGKVDWSCATAAVPAGSEGSPGGGEGGAAGSEGVPGSEGGAGGAAGSDDDDDDTDTDTESDLDMEGDFMEEED